ncbi:MAG: DoxX family membrane protein [Deltaproteobacteria bacterium]|nr:DoxX family membrane protein [Deltaproteobacteria bacterium]
MEDRQVSFGLLLLRLGGGALLLYGRAWENLAMLRNGHIVFPDPFGLGAETSWALAVFAEFFCSIFVMLGILTKLTAMPPLLAMLLLEAVLPPGTPWSQRGIFFLHALPFLVLTFTGAGDYSFDARVVSSRSTFRS